MQDKIMYGLYNKKHRKLMQFNVRYDAEYHLDLIGDYELSGLHTFWLVDKMETAKRAATNNVSWDNSEYDVPCNEYIDDGLEVVEVRLSVSLPLSCLHDTDS